MEFSQKTSLVNAEEPDASGRLVWKILIKWQIKRDITKKDQNKTKSTRTNDTSQSLRSTFSDDVLASVDVVFDPTLWQVELGCVATIFKAS